MAITAARELGFDRIACASTGNLANSVAAHAARIGMPSIVFIPSDLEPAKIVQTAIYGGTLVGVEGSYDDVNRLCSELSETDEFESTGFVNVNVRPYYAEGSKTLGFEVAEQLGWRMPGAGRRADGVGLAADQGPQGVQGAARRRPGRRRPTWKVFGAQSAGCSPIATAFDNGWDVVQPVKPTGIAKSLNIGNPGRRSVRARRRPHDRRRDGRGRRRRDPRGHPTAGPHDRRLRRDRRRRDHRRAEEAGRAGQLDTDVETVVYNTGDGLKTLDAVAEDAQPTAIIPPTLKGMREAGLL